MKLNIRNISVGILALFIIVNLLVIFKIQYFYIETIFIFIFLITIPGLLIMLMFKIRKIEFWEYLVYTIGLGIAFLIFGGLAVNGILPWLHITDKPLSLIPLLISFDIFLSLFGLIAYKRNKDISLKIKPPKLDWLNKIFFITPVFFLLLSILGAITLNNGGSNYLTMIMLGSIAMFIFINLFFYKKLNENVYPWSILMISLSLLLMFSLRSWHVIGWDINQEYEVFQLTKKVFHWSMLNFPKNAYNACLSVTILPTILNSFLRINSEYIFKIGFQTIFAFVPLVVFLLLKRYSDILIAFLASFFFMSQYQFMQEMPALTRQEIAFLFFSLALLILFNEHINSGLKRILFIVFGFSMTLSHYSTTYVALTLFIFTYLICLIYRQTKNKFIFSKIYEILHIKEKGQSGGRNYYISGLSVLLLLVFAFLWFYQVTGITDGLTDSIKNTINNLGKVFSENVRSENTSIFSQFNIFYKPKDKSLLLQNYINSLNLQHKDNILPFLFPTITYEKYNPKVMIPQVLPIKIDSNITFILNLIMEIFKKGVKVFIIIGVVSLIFKESRKTNMSIEFIIMFPLCLVIIGLMTVLPTVSLEYPIERLYQQTLIILSLPAILGGLCFLKYRFVIKNLVLTSFIIYFLFASGFIMQIIGGSEPYVILNNFGQIYDGIYVRDGEIRAIVWLSKYNTSEMIVHTDRFGHWKIRAYAQLRDIFKEVFPQIMNKNDYVYSGYTNTNKQRAFIALKGTDIIYNFPTDFLNQNYNIIYNNGDCEVYK